MFRAFGCRLHVAGLALGSSWLPVISAIAQPEDPKRVVLENLADLNIGGIKTPRPEDVA